MTAFSMNLNSCQVQARANRHSKSEVARTASSATAVSANRTTSLSTAVVIPQKQNVTQKRQVKLEDTSDNAASQEFFEEDDAEECEAALFSPKKGHK